MTVVLVTQNRFSDLEPERSALTPLGAEVVEASSDTELARLAPQADVLLVSAATRVDAGLIGLMSRCRAIIRYGVGVELVDVDAATRAGIPVGNVVDASVEEVGDHAVALALALLRRIAVAEQTLRGGGWGLAGLAGLRRLSSLTAGIVGLGRIGHRVAERFAALGLTVVGHDPFLDQSPFTHVSLEDLLTTADVVSVHLLLTDATRGLLSRSNLALLSPEAVVVNVSRGGVIDEAALAEMLRAGRLAGAALDVFSEEPLSADSDLRSAPNLILTPHVAWYSEQAVRELQEKAAAQAARALQGERLHPVVNPSVYAST